MHRLSPLNFGQIYRPSSKVLDAVTLVIERSPKDSLALGLMPEYIHDEAFTNAGLLFEKPLTTAFYDRAYAGMLQDDKLATYMAGTLSTTHTISSGEYSLWTKMGDAAIMSWEMVDENFNSGFRFCGIISFASIVREGLIRPSKINDGYFFDRSTAIKKAALE